MKTVYWRLTPGNPLFNQATYEQNMANGLAYIEKLKENGEVIESVITEQRRLVINIAEEGDPIPNTEEDGN